MTSLSSTASAEEKWGTVKGRVVWVGAVPERPVIDKAQVDPKCKECAALGKTLSDDWVIDPTSKGVRWVMVWLLHESGDFDKPIPIHPALAKAAPKVVLDQPCCMFEPHHLGMRTGQILVARNSAKFVHNVNIAGGDDNPNKNTAVPPGTELEIPGWKASAFAVPVSCGIHGWMNAKIRVFAHPYFAVTNEMGEFEINDAPAGKYRIAVWNDLWIVGGKKGMPLEIKPGAVTDLGESKAQP